MSKICANDEVQITYKQNLNVRKFGQILKSDWYTKYDQTNDEFLATILQRKK